MSDEHEDRVPCPRCRATGLAPLTPHLQRALDEARECVVAGEPITAHAVAARLDEPLPANPTAICNRLAELEHLGFLRRYGRVGRRLAFDLNETPATEAALGERPTVPSTMTGTVTIPASGYGALLARVEAEARIERLRAVARGVLLDAEHSLPLREEGQPDFVLPMTYQGLDALLPGDLDPADDGAEFVDIASGRESR